jgi:hypothetical protein
MKITLNKPTIYQVGRVRLLPGDNEVSGKDVHRMMQNKIVQADIAAGVLTVEHDAPKKATKPVAEVLEVQVDDMPEPEKDEPEAEKKPVTVRRRRKKAAD